MRERFARKMLNVWKITSSCFFFSLYSLLLALVFMGWGGGFHDEAYIPAIVGSIGIVLIVIGAWRVRVMSWRVPVRTDCGS